MMRALCAAMLTCWSLACLAQTCPARDDPVEGEAGAIQTPQASAGAGTGSAALAESQAKQSLRKILAASEFSPEETIRIPSLKNRKAVAAAEKPQPWMQSLEGFFRGVAYVLRAGAWVLAGLGIVLLVLTLHYWWRIRAPRFKAVSAQLPVRVGGLDIRPETLPDDIGAEARRLWIAGDAAGALSLLYRGALSALVLRFSAAIRASSTEQECLRAARGVLATPPAGYFEALTRAWQSTVYAQRRPDAAAALALCDEFAHHFSPTPERAA
jgi:hypothetical protein